MSPCPLRGPEGQFADHGTPWPLRWDLSKVTQAREIGPTCSGCRLEDAQSLDVHPQGLFPEAEDTLSSFAPSLEAELTEPSGAWSSGTMLGEDTPSERPWA